MRATLIVFILKQSAYAVAFFGRTHEVTQKQNEKLFSIKYKLSF